MSEDLLKKLIGKNKKDYEQAASLIIDNADIFAHTIKVVSGFESSGISPK